MKELVFDILTKNTDGFYCVKEGDNTLVLFITSYKPFCDVDFPYAQIDNNYIIYNSVYKIKNDIENSIAALGFEVNGRKKIHLKLKLYENGFLNGGKNTLLYHNKYGSYFVINSFYINNVNIEYGQRDRTENFCGACRCCIKACPTGAITDSGFIREKCLRHHMDFFVYDDNIASKMGNKILGCNICQSVCPKNNDIQKQQVPSELKEYCQLENLFKLAKDGKKALKYLSEQVGENMARCKRVLSLVINAMGNSGDKGYLKYLDALECDDKISANLQRAKRLLKNKD